MDSDSSVELICACIRDSRCRLCQFEVQNGDSVVAFTFNYHESPPGQVPDPDDTRRLCYFTFDGFAYEDAEHNVSFHRCIGDCQFTDFVTPLFHKTCYHFAPRLGPVTTDLLTATEISFQPSSFEKKRRLSYLQGNLREALSEALPLPSEIIAMVADLLLHDYAATKTRTQMLQCALAPEFAVSLPDDIYARLQDIDGVRYIQSLSNSGSETELVLRANDIGPVRGVAVAEDHVGIRQLYLSSSACSSSTDCIAVGIPDTTNGRREPIPDTWWRHISRPDGIASIRARTDGFKLRDITAVSEAMLLSGVRWAHPEHPVQIVDLDARHRPKRFISWLRMCYFDCNAPGTIGYSIATDGLSVGAIHAHHEDEDLDATMYGNSIWCWLYMPVDEGEYLTEIAVRYHSRSVIAMLFTTNRARRTLFGAYSRTAFDVIAIHKPPKEKSRIWFNHWESVPDRQLRYMAFEQATPGHQLLRSLSTPVPDLPHTHSTEPWFFSSCSLKDIAMITTCRDTSLSHQPITGMLLRYTSGHTTCLGWFRFDYTLRQVPVGEGQVQVEEGRGLDFQMQRTAAGLPYVADFAVRPQSDHTHWFALGSEDMLEWCFTNRHSVIRKAMPR